MTIQKDVPPPTNLPVHSLAQDDADTHRYIAEYNKRVDAHNAWADEENKVIHWLNKTKVLREGIIEGSIRMRNSAQKISGIKMSGSGTQGVSSAGKAWITVSVLDLLR